MEEEAVVEDPLCHLVSDTDSELKEDIKQVRVSDEGSKPQFVNVGCARCAYVWGGRHKCRYYHHQ